MQPAIDAIDPPRCGTMRIPPTPWPSSPRAIGYQTSAMTANSPSATAATTIACWPPTSVSALRNNRTLNQNTIQRCRSTSGSPRLRYHAVRRSKPVWNHMRYDGGTAERRSTDHFAASIGVSVNETNSENSVATVTTMPNSFMYWPTKPLKNASGKKTTTSTSVIAIAAPPISVRPLMAASAGACPMSRCRVMFSSTTIESSTRIPMISESPISETLSSVSPITRMTQNVASSELGIAIITTAAFRHACRNSISTIAVSTMPSSSDWFTPLSDACV